MTGRALTILAIVVIFGAAVGAYVIKQTPTALEDEREVRAHVLEFGTKLQQVSLLADATMVADAMAREYGPYVSPALLTEWQQDPLKAPGRTTSSPWPDRIEITTVQKESRTSYTVEGFIIEVTNEGGGIDEAPTEAARRPITLDVEKNGSWRIVRVQLGAYPGDGEWKLSEPNAQGIQFLYPEKLPTSFIATTAEGWPPLVELVVSKYSCKEGPITASDGPIKTLTRRMVGDREYCVATSSGAAAGSMYRTYEYTTAQGDYVARVVFTLRFPQCLNYDEPQQSACTSEETRFDIDGLADRIAQSIRML